MKISEGVELEENTRRPFGMVGILENCLFSIIHILYLLLYSFYYMYRLIGYWIEVLKRDDKKAWFQTRKQVSNYGEDTLSKYPSNLSFTIDESMLCPYVRGTNSESVLDEKVSRKILQIIEWSLTAFPHFKQNYVQSLTFYDKSGILENHQNDIFNVVKKELETCSTIKDTIDITNLDVNNMNNFNHTPVMRVHYRKIENNQNRVLDIRFISFATSGKPNIAKLADSICNDIKDKTRVDIKQTVNSTIQSYVKECIPEPNLLLAFSKPVLILHGFPPLHLKYTQIV